MLGDLFRRKGFWLEDLADHPTVLGVPIGRDGAQGGVSVDVGLKFFATASMADLADASPHIKQKLLEHGGLQCGICTPGVVIAAKALLEHNPDPTEEQARYWLAGNLCRCTGYDKIIRAVLDAAKTMRGEAA